MLKKRKRKKYFYGEIANTDVQTKRTINGLFQKSAMALMTLQIYYMPIANVYFTNYFKNASYQSSLTFSETFPKLSFYYYEQRRKKSGQ